MEDLSKGSNRHERGLAEKVPKGRWVISVSFAMVFVLFFFSFADFRCNGVTVASVSGYDLVFGKHLRNVAGDYARISGVPEQLITDLPSGDRVGGGPGESEWIKPNSWAILSLAAAIIGLFIFLKGDIKDEEKLGIALSVLGETSLVILGIVVESKTRQQAENAAAIDVGFRAAYWLCLIFFALALTTSYLRLKDRTKGRNVIRRQVISKLNVFISTSPGLLKKDP